MAMQDGTRAKLRRWAWPAGIALAVLVAAALFSFGRVSAWYMARRYLATTYTDRMVIERVWRDETTDHFVVDVHPVCGTL
jgi:hypothetical protein